VLMCGVSASLLFAIVTRLVERDEEEELEKSLGQPASQTYQDSRIRSTELAERVETESKEDSRSEAAITQ
jgi:hypothetical protein